MRGRPRVARTSVTRQAGSATAGPITGAFCSPLGPKRTNLQFRELLPYGQRSSTLSTGGMLGTAGPRCIDKRAATDDARGGQLAVARFVIHVTLGVYSQEGKLPMSLTSFWQVFAVGTFGGAFLELLHWWNLRRRNPRFPKYATSLFYWLVTLLMALAGGSLALFYFGERAEALLAFHVGLSAPLIAQKLATTMAQPGARSANGLRLTDFFTW